MKDEPTLNEIWKAIGNYSFYGESNDGKARMLLKLFPALRIDQAEAVSKKFSNLFEFVSKVSQSPFEGDFITRARSTCPGFADEIYQNLLDYCDYMNQR